MSTEVGFATTAHIVFQEIPIVSTMITSFSMNQKVIRCSFEKSGNRISKKQRYN